MSLWLKNHVYCVYCKSVVSGSPLEKLNGNYIESIQFWYEKIKPLVIKGSYKICHNHNYYTWKKRVAFFGQPQTTNKQSARGQWPGSTHAVYYFSFLVLQCNSWTCFFLLSAMSNLTWEVKERTMFRMWKGQKSLRFH